MQPIPVNRYLVPAATPALDATFATFGSTLDGAVPATLPLDASWQATLAIPTGLGTTWRDAGPATTILDSAAEAAPSDPAAPPDPLARPPARLIARGANGIAAVLPLVLGARTQTAGIEIVVTGFLINAGTLRGASGAGSSVSFAWRRTTSAVDHFSDPPINEHLLRRLPSNYRLKSWTNVFLERGLIPKRVIRPLREIITWR